MSTALSHRRCTRLVRALLPLVAFALASAERPRGTEDLLAAAAGAETVRRRVEIAADAVPAMLAEDSASGSSAMQAGAEALAHPQQSTAETAGDGDEASLGRSIMKLAQEMKASSRGKKKNLNAASAEDLFGSFDTDGDGAIDSNEFVSLGKVLIGQYKPNNGADIDAILPGLMMLFEAFDLDGSGALDQTEFANGYKVLGRRYGAPNAQEAAQAPAKVPLTGSDALLATLSAIKPQPNSQSLSADQVKESYQAFYRFDADRSGSLKSAEFQTFLLDFTSHSAYAEVDVDKIMTVSSTLYKRFDIDKDGVMGFAEFSQVFVALVLSAPSPAQPVQAVVANVVLEKLQLVTSKGNLELAITKVQSSFVYFEGVDADKDWRLSLREFRSFARRMKLDRLIMTRCGGKAKLSSTEVSVYIQEIFKYYDKDGDRYQSYGEFSLLYTSIKVAYGSELQDLPVEKGTPYMPLFEYREVKTITAVEASNCYLYFQRYSMLSATDRVLMPGSPRVVDVGAGDDSSDDDLSSDDWVYYHLTLSAYNAFIGSLDLPSANPKLASYDTTTVSALIVDSFIIFDSDRDGVLSFMEFTVLYHAIGQAYPELLVAPPLQRSVQLPAFAAKDVLKLHTTVMTSCYQVFSSGDKDKDHALNLQEFIYISTTMSFRTTVSSFRSLGSDSYEVALFSMFFSHDKDRSMSLSFSEFAFLYTTVTAVAAQPALPSLATPV